MTGRASGSIVDLADEVVGADVSSQMLYGQWTKGHTATQIGSIPGRSRFVSLLATAVATVLVATTGIATGVILFGGQPGPSPVAHVPTQQPQPTLTPGQTPLLTPTIEPTEPATEPPTEPPSEPPVKQVETPLDGLAGLIDLEMLISLVDELTDPGTPNPAEEPRDSPEFANLTGVALGRADLTPAALAIVGDWIAARDDVAVIQERYSCLERNVFCGPPQLAPGPYYFVGFGTLAPPPTEGVDQIYQVFYLLTDPDGDWSNNAFTTPPLTDRPLNSMQYQIEGGWYGAVGGLGETDIQGPVGPDGQTPRYNQPPSTRLVLTHDPPGGFFIVPESLMGNWFRLASYWQDFGAGQGVLSIDNAASVAPNGLIPVAGTGSLPSVLACARAQALAQSLDGEAEQILFYLGMPDGAALPPGTIANVTLISNGETVAHDGLPLEDLGTGRYLARVGVGVDVSHGISGLVLVPPAGAPIDATEDFIVMAGNGVNLPAGFEGLLLGDPTCGA